MTQFVDKWNKIKINNNNIEYTTNNAYLIKLPNKSEFAGYKFWVSYKLINEYDNYIILSCKDDFEFQIFNKNDKDIITGDMLKDIFECMNDSCQEKNDESYLIIQEPEKIDIDVEIDEELLNE